MATARAPSTSAACGMWSGSRPTARRSASSTQGRNSPPRSQACRTRKGQVMTAHCATRRAGALPVRPRHKRGGRPMGRLVFGLLDSFSVHETSRPAVAAAIYEQHIREVQLAELLGYSSYFIIEHQNAHMGQITAPSVYPCTTGH